MTVLSRNAVMDGILLTCHRIGKHIQTHAPNVEMMVRGARIIERMVLVDFTNSEAVEEVTADAWLYLNIRPTQSQHWE